MKKKSEREDSREKKKGEGERRKAKKKKKKEWRSERKKKRRRREWDGNIYPWWSKENLIIIEHIWLLFECCFCKTSSSLSLHLTYLNIPFSAAVDSIQYSYRSTPQSIIWVAHYLLQNTIIVGIDVFLHKSNLCEDETMPYHCSRLSANISFLLLFL